VQLSEGELALLFENKSEISKKRLIIPKTDKKQSLLT
jgi:hypothetical protein